MSDSSVAPCATVLRLERLELPLQLLHAPLQSSAARRAASVAPRDSPDGPAVTFRRRASASEAMPRRAPSSSVTARAERLRLRAHEHDQPEQAVMVVQRQADARTPADRGGQRLHLRALEPVRFVGRR